jgi:penicillin-binding protein 1C
MLASLLAAGAASAAVPSFESVRAAHRPSDTTLLDRHGTPIQTLRTDMTVRRLAWLPLAELSP